MRRVEEIAQAYGLTMEWGNSVHLLQGRIGIASIHDIGLENDLCVKPDFERGQDLFRDLATELFDVTPTGPVEWHVGDRDREVAPPLRR